jgi:thiol:disulfide interchange protein DsbC
MQRMGGISRHLVVFVLSAWLVLAPSPSALSFDKSGCASGECRDCHRLTPDEAASLLGSRADRVLKVGFSDVPGMWVLEAEKAGRRQVLYLPFSRSHVFTSPPHALGKPPPAPRDTARIDPDRIPLDDALVLGRRDAPRRVIVFTDPLCPACRKLHPLLEEAVRSDPDLVFFIKLNPLPANPGSFDICLSLLASRSPDDLSRAFRGDPLPPATGGGEELERNARLARDLGIHQLPALLLPDGRLLAGMPRAGTALSTIVHTGKASL